jgi:hypothetical protein
MQVTLHLKAIEDIITLIKEGIIEVENASDIIELLTTIKQYNGEKEFLREHDLKDVLEERKLKSFIAEQGLFESELRDLYDYFTSNEILHTWEDELTPDEKDDEKFYSLRNKAIELAEENNWKALEPVLIKLGDLLNNYALI